MIMIMIDVIEVDNVIVDYDEDTYYNDDDDNFNSYLLCYTYYFYMLY